MQVQGSLRRVLEYVAFVYASHYMHMSNSQASTCHSEHGRITGAAVSSEIFIDEIAEDISTI